MLKRRWRRVPDRCTKPDVEVGFLSPSNHPWNQTNKTNMRNGIQFVQCVRRGRRQGVVEIRFDWVPYYILTIYYSDYFHRTCCSRQPFWWNWLFFFSRWLKKKKSTLGSSSFVNDVTQRSMAHIKEKRSSEKGKERVAKISRFYTSSGKWRRRQFTVGQRFRKVDAYLSRWSCIQDQIKRKGGRKKKKENNAE